MFESSYRLDLKKNGKSFFKQPITFTVSTCLQLITPFCEMVYMSTENDLEKGDQVVCSLRDPGGNLYPVFTGEVFKTVPLSEGRVGLILETDISNREVNISFVEEEAENILIEILNQAGISNYNLDIPKITINRFSLQGMGKGAIFSFLDLMNKYGSFNAFFDQDNVFCFLPDHSLPAGIVSYERGKNILLLEDKKLTSFALPVLAGQMVSVGGEKQKITRSVLKLSSSQSRTVCYWEGK